MTFQQLQGGNNLQNKIEMSELYIPIERPTRNLVNGRFLKGHTPHNKGEEVEIPFKME